MTPAEFAALKAAGRKPFLVCAYQDGNACAELAVGDSVALGSFAEQAPALGKTVDVVFYCACPNDEYAKEQAALYKGLGFQNAKFLKGGHAALLKQVAA